MRRAAVVSALRLSGFRYLKWQRLLVLTFISAAVSFLFSLTALSLNGFYRGFTAYLGEGEGILVVYSPRSRTPYTGLVPAYIAEKLACVNGVLASSPEVMAPCILNGEAVFLRGLMPESFTALNAPRMVEGVFLNRSDINAAVIGERVARRLGIKMGEKILLLGVLADRYVELWVKGIFRTGSMPDDEILAPLHVGQWLRGASYGYITLIRLKIDRNATMPAEVLKAVEAEASKEEEPSQPEQQIPKAEIPWAKVRFRLEDIGIQEASKYMISYMEKYGVTRESLLTLLAAVFLFSSSSIILATETILAQHKGEISVLRALGASKKS